MVKMLAALAAALLLLTPGRAGANLAWKQDTQGEILLKTYKCSKSVPHTAWYKYKYHECKVPRKDDSS